MLSKEVLELSKQHSVIRDIFEFGMQRAKEVGAENVFDFSIGNPSVPAPKEVDETAIRFLKTLDPVEVHGYTSGNHGSAKGGCRFPKPQIWNRLYGK